MRYFTDFSTEIISKELLRFQKVKIMIEKFWGVFYYFEGRLYSVFSDLRGGGLGKLDVISVEKGYISCKYAILRKNWSNK